MPGHSFWTDYFKPAPVFMFSSAYIRDEVLEDPTEGDIAYLRDPATMTVYRGGEWVPMERNR